LHDINRKVFNKSQFHPRFVRQYADLNSVIEQRLPASTSPMSASVISRRWMRVIENPP